MFEQLALKGVTISWSAIWNLFLHDWIEEGYLIKVNQYFSLRSAYWSQINLIEKFDDVRNFPDNFIMKRVDFWKELALDMCPCKSLYSN